MENVTLKPGMLCGTVKVPPSKSVAHRAIIAAALSGGRCVLHNAALSDDISATLGGMSRLGCKHTVNRRAGTITLAPKTSKMPSGELEIDCCESGSTLRFLIPIALLTGRSIKLTGRGRLMERPMKPYFDLFEKKGILYEQGDGYLRLSGQLSSGLFEIPGNVSSQFITGLLFALPLLSGDSEIVVTTATESKSYIDITLDVLEKFGIEIENHDYMRFTIRGGQSYRQRDYIIESDYSQAAFFLVAGAIGCDILCTGLPDKSFQGDREIVDIIERTGAVIERTDGGIRAIQSGNMHGITVDARNIPDLVPILTVLLSFCKGESRIINAGRLRMKESDRLAAIASEMKHLGADITEDSESLKIIGRQALECRTVSAWNDHRIAMSLAVAACRCEGDALTILGADKAVRKSYPDFFEVYERLCGEEMC